MMDYNTHRSKGYGFVTFASEGSVTLAIGKHTIAGKISEVKRDRAGVATKVVDNVNWLIVYNRYYLGM